ncbi:molybdopterin-guanine dinucleotide biosynthesis protein A [Rhodovibrionaceae bacterium A322]
MGRSLLLAFAAFVLGMGVTLSPALASDDEAAIEKKPSHEGYYYPKLTSEETYISRGRVMEEAERTLRVGFITAFANGMMESPSPLPFVIFAKGAEAQKLIIVAVKDGPFDTLFRARANLAQLTAVARTMPLLAEYGVQDWFTYFDLIRMLGFEEIVVSDGKNWAHRINLK